MIPFVGMSPLQACIKCIVQISVKRGEARKPRPRRAVAEAVCSGWDQGAALARQRKSASPFANHAVRRLGIAAHQRRHNRRVSNAQLVDAANR